MNVILLLYPLLYYAMSAADNDLGETYLVAFGYRPQVKNFASTQ